MTTPSVATSVETTPRFRVHATAGAARALVVTTLCLILVVGFLAQVAGGAGASREAEWPASPSADASLDHRA